MMRARFDGRTARLCRMRAHPFLSSSCPALGLAAAGVARKEKKL
jgi:hypothetical protein